jgi:hypothetical protein
VEQLAFLKTIRLNLRDRAAVMRDVKLSARRDAYFLLA